MVRRIGARSLTATMQADEFFKVRFCPTHVYETAVTY